MNTTGYLQEIIVIIDHGVIKSCKSNQNYADIYSKRPNKPNKCK